MSCQTVVTYPLMNGFTISNSTPTAKKITITEIFPPKEDREYRCETSREDILLSGNLGGYTGVLPVNPA